MKTELIFATTLFASGAGITSFGIWNNILVSVGLILGTEGLILMCYLEEELSRPKK